MKIDTPFINGLLNATDQAMPGASDSTVEVPSILLPVHTPVLPLAALLNRGEAPNESFCVHDSINKVNPDAASSLLLCTLGKGLWTVNILTSSGILGAAGVYNPQAYMVTLFYQGVLIPLMIENSFSNVLHQRQTNIRTLHFLFRDEAAISLFWDAPAVGERIAVEVSISATKHL